MGLLGTTLLLLLASGASAQQQKPAPTINRGNKVYTRADYIVKLPDAYGEDSDQTKWCADCTDGKRWDQLTSSEDVNPSMPQGSGGGGATNGFQNGAGDGWKRQADYDLHEFFYYLNNDKFSEAWDKFKDTGVPEPNNWYRDMRSMVGSNSILNRGNPDSDGSESNELVSLMENVLSNNNNLPFSSDSEARKNLRRTTAEKLGYCVHTWYAAHELREIATKSDAKNQYTKLMEAAFIYMGAAGSGAFENQIEYDADALTGNREQFTSAMGELADTIIATGGGSNGPADVSEGPFVKAISAMAVPYMQAMEKYAWLLENNGGASDAEKAEWWAELYPFWVCVRGVFPESEVDKSDASTIEGRIAFQNSNGEARTLDDLDTGGIFGFIRDKIRSNLNSLGLPDSDDSTKLPGNKENKVVIEEGTKAETKNNDNASQMGEYWQEASGATGVFAALPVLMTLVALFF